MELISYIGLDNLSKDGRTLWGAIPATSQADRIYFEHIWKYNPQIKNVVEFGTLLGITSLYFGMFVALRGGKLITFDFVDERLKEVKKIWLPEMEYIKMDILVSAQQKVIEYISKPDTFVFIDNGNKAKEVLLYTEHVANGNIVAVHDWAPEGNEAVSLPHLLNLGYKELFPDIRRMTGTGVRGFIRECK
jgi:predicted O-methyltransferase YrrM